MYKNKWTDHKLIRKDQWGLSDDVSVTYICLVIDINVQKAFILPFW